LTLNAAFPRDLPLQSRLVRNQPYDEAVDLSSDNSMDESVDTAIVSGRHSPPHPGAGASRFHGLLQNYTHLSPPITHQRHHTPNTPRAHPTRTCSYVQPFPLCAAPTALPMCVTLARWAFDRDSDALVFVAADVVVQVRVVRVAGVTLPPLGTEMTLQSTPRMWRSLEALRLAVRRHQVVGQPVAAVGVVQVRLDRRAHLSLPISPCSVLHPPLHPPML
jgi:hypothetical protein